MASKLCHDILKGKPVVFLPHKMPFVCHWMSHMLIIIKTLGVTFSFLLGNVKVNEVTGILLSSNDNVFPPDVSADISFLMEFVQHSGNSSKLSE